MLASPASLCGEMVAYSEPPLPESSNRSPILPLPARPAVAAITAPTSTPRNSTLPSSEWLRRIAVAMLETTHSLRPLHQLRGAVAPVVCEQLSRRRLPQWRGQPVSLKSIRVAQLRPDALEVSGTFAANGGFYPLAFRMELSAKGWQATACDIGPH